MIRQRQSRTTTLKVTKQARTQSGYASEYPIKKIQKSMEKAGLESQQYSQTTMHREVKKVRSRQVTHTQQPPKTPHGYNQSPASVTMDL